MKKMLSVLLVGLLAVSMLAGCASEAPAASGGDATPAASDDGGGAPAANSDITIGLSMDALESGFWVANEAAILAHAEKLGVKINEVIAEGDANKQNDQMKNLIAQGVDVIICAPKDGAAIASAVKEAQAAGIPVIMDNRPIQGDGVEADLTLLSDNETMAKEEMQWFVDKAKEDGKTYKALLLIGNLADENATERYNGHKAVLDANPDVVEVVSEVPTEWNQEVALKGIQNAFQANPEIDLIIAPSDILCSPIRSALEQIDRFKKIGEDGHVAILTFDGDTEGMQLLKDGYSWADSAQAATKTGELCVEWAIKLANGEKPDQKVIKDPGILATVDNLEEVKDQVWGYADTK